MARRSSRSASTTSASPVTSPRSTVTSRWTPNTSPPQPLRCSSCATSRGVGKREEGAGKRERRALRVASSYERQPTNHKLPFLLSILLALLTPTPLIAGADQQGVVGLPVTGDAVG